MGGSAVQENGVLAWRGGVPAHHPQPAPRICPTRLGLLYGGLSVLTSLELLSATMPSLAAVYMHSQLNVPLDLFVCSSAPLYSLCWVFLSVCQVPK